MNQLEEEEEEEVEKVCVVVWQEEWWENSQKLREEFGKGKKGKNSEEVEEMGVGDETC